MHFSTQHINCLRLKKRYMLFSRKGRRYIVIIITKKQRNERYDRLPLSQQSISFYSSLFFYCFINYIIKSIINCLAGALIQQIII